VVGEVTDQKEGPTEGTRWARNFGKERGRLKEVAIGGKVKICLSEDLNLGKD